MEKDERVSAKWGSASNTCKMAGKRLPDYHEWRMACDGKTDGAAGTTDPFYSNITGNWEWASSRPGAANNGLESGATAAIAGNPDCASVGMATVRGINGSEGIVAFRCVR